LAYIYKAHPVRLATLTVVLSILGLPLAGLTPAMAAERWYSSEQVERGRTVFQEHCASCHGVRAQGVVEEWQKTGEDGKYPPPPLNGTAHAWRHSLAVLRRTIREGNAKLAGGRCRPSVTALTRSIRMRRSPISSLSGRTILMRHG
jgi:hypothetical protein